MTVPSMNQINLTAFAQKIIDNYNLQYNTLQRILDEDKVTDHFHYKKTVGAMKAIRQCHDTLIAEYNAVVGNHPTLSAEKAPIDVPSSPAVEPVTQVTERAAVVLETSTTEGV